MDAEKSVDGRRKNNFSKYIFLHIPGVLVSERVIKVVIDGMTENDLIKKAQDGDEDALNSLITNYYQAVFAYFYKNTSQYHQSKDLTQEVFIKMVSGISRYKPKASFKSWLFTIASNHLKNYYRLLSRHPEDLELSDDILTNESVTSEINEIQMRNDIKVALSHLPSEQRETVILRFYNDFSIKEISKITGAMETTVKARIRYGLEKLKKELEGYDEKGK